MEIMVVIVILGMIASAVGLSVFENLKTAKRRTAALDLKNLGSALKVYYSQKGRLPESSEGLAALVQGRQLHAVPLDPWGHPYVYSLEGASNYVVMSYGADGQPGGTDDNEDLVESSHPNRG